MYYIKPRGERKSLRKLVEDKETYIVPGVFNPFAALLAEKMGFKVAYLSGAAITGSLAMPDLGLITLTELSFFTKLITKVTTIPLIVDVDTGFGEVLNVMRTIVEMEEAGASAIQIEDQEMPKKCGHLSGKRLIPAEDMVKKIRAAVEARSSKEFIIIARTDARGVVGMDEAIERAKMYLKAGADVIFPEALKSLEEFRTFSENVKAPLLANMTEFGKTPYIEAEKFTEIGYKFVLFPVTTFRACAKTIMETLETLKKEGTQKNILNKLMTRQEFYELIDYQKYQETDEKIAKKSDQNPLTDPKPKHS
ncbi:MAG: methylisocitrate lyase [Candidatus Njordarchaeia archaeon]